MSGPRCHIKACQHALEANVGRDGRVRWACPVCARRKAGRCLDCPAAVQGRAWRCARCRRRHLARLAREKRRPGSERLGRYSARQLARKDARRCVECEAPVQGRSWRCEACKHTALLAACRRSYRKHHDAVLARERARYQTNDAERVRRNEYKKRWRAANRRKVVMEKRRWRLEGKPGGWASREKYEAYHRAYRERYREKYRAQARERYYREHPVRPDPKCRECGVPVPWDGKHRPRAYCPDHAPAWRRYLERRRDQQPAA